AKRPRVRRRSPPPCVSVYRGGFALLLPLARPPLSPPLQNSHGARDEILSRSLVFAACSPYSLRVTVATARPAALLPLFIPGRRRRRGCDAGTDDKLDSRHLPRQGGRLRPALGLEAGSGGSGMVHTRRGNGRGNRRREHLSGRRRFRLRGSADRPDRIGQTP